MEKGYSAQADRFSMRNYNDPLGDRVYGWALKSFEYHLYFPQLQIPQFPPCALYDLSGKGNCGKRFAHNHCY
jgi:hypothetical protein